MPTDHHMQYFCHCPCCCLRRGNYRCLAAFGYRFLRCPLAYGPYLPIYLQAGCSFSIPPSFAGFHYVPRSQSDPSPTPAQICTGQGKVKRDLEVGEIAGIESTGSGAGEDAGEHYLSVFRRS